MRKRAPEGGRENRWGVLAWLAVVAILVLTGCEGAGGTTPGGPGTPATASATVPAAAPASTQAHKVVVVGDSLSTGMGSSARDAWPSLISAEPLDPDDSFDVVNASQNGSGYVTVGANNSTFGAQVEQAVTSDTALVVFFGSENDMGHSSADIGAAAAAAFAAAKAKSPHAVVLAVGPPAYTSQPKAARLAVRDAVQNAATDAGALFVDPISEGWFIGEVAELVGPDGVHPTVAGQRYLQAQLEKLIKEEINSTPAAKAK